MTQSPEYPDLPWVTPASWTNANRTSVQLVVIHATDGSERGTSAEDGAAYDARRTDGTSTHYFHDQDSTIQCVRTEDQAHAARAQGNKRGIQHELCGMASQSAAQWADAASLGALRQAAKQVARDCAKWDIPIRRVSVSQVAAGVKGICGHVDITYAFPQDSGDHTDPGPHFPWATFIQMVEDESMTTVDDFLAALKDPRVKTAFASAVLDDPVNAAGSAAGHKTSLRAVAAWSDNNLNGLSSAVQATRDAVAETPDLAAAAVLKLLSTGGSVDELDDILRAGMTPEHRLALAARLMA